jgi:hypothetical protein
LWPFFKKNFHLQSIISPLGNQKTIQSNSYKDFVQKNVP